MADTKKHPPEKNKRREPKARPISAEWLERAALHYLERFSATRARLIDVLWRKARRRAYDQPIPNEAETWITAVADKCVRLGYVDDAAYAKSRAQAMLARGKPERLITQDLRHKGVSADLIAQAINTLGEQEGENGPDRLMLRAAVALARRRRFGAFSHLRLSGRDVPMDKQLAAMMRGGFPYELSRRVLEAVDPEALLDDMI